MQTTSCPNCKASVLTGYVFCPMCGTRLQTAPATPPAPEIAATELAIAASDHPAQALSTAAPDAEDQVALPAAEPTQDAADQLLPSSWSLHKDSWNGFSVALPPEWRASTGNGLVHVYEAQQPLCSALFWPIHLPQPVPVQQVAQQFVDLVHQANPAAQLRQQEGTGSEAGHVVLSASSTLQGQQIEGHYTAMVDGQNALVSGFACPTDLLDGHTAIFARVLSSFHAIPASIRQQLQEPGEGAFTLQLPQGWLFSGGINRNQGPMGVVQFTVARDQQALVAASVPALHWSYVENMAASGMFAATGGPQNMRHMPAKQYCEQILPQWMSRFHQDLRVESVEDQPELSAALKAQTAAAGIAGNSDVSNASLTTSYSEGGSRLLQKTRLAVYSTPGAQAFGVSAPSVWSASINSYCRAPQAEFTQWEAILDGIIASVVMNPAWQQEEQRRAQNNMMQSNAQSVEHMQQIVASNNQNIAQIHRLGQINRPASYGLSAAYQPGSANRDQFAHSFTNYISDQQDVTGGQGGVYTVPTGHNQYWLDNTTNTIYGGDWRTDRPDSNWSPLNATGT